MQSRIWFLSLITIIGCQQEEQNTYKPVEKAYSQDIGDIKFDSLKDDAGFVIFDSLNLSTSRRGLAYKGMGLSKRIQAQYQFDPSFQAFSGFITIRFVVNCEMKSDRFRVESSDFYFNSTESPSSLQKELLRIVRNLDGWMPASSRYESLDHAKFLNFKIVNGKIINVLQ